MMRSRILYIVTVLLLLSTTSLYPQRYGATPLDESAMSHLYQKPPRWSGLRYTNTPTTFNRLYITAGADNSTMWRYNSDYGDINNSWMARFGVGYNFSPVHTLELGVDVGSLGDYDATRIDASYLFNVTSYANMSEGPSTLEIFAKAGVGYYFSTLNSVHLQGALRVKYNITKTFGIYVEPGFGLCTYVGDESIYNVGDLTPYVQFGMSVNIGNIITSSERTMQCNRGYWEANNYSDRRPLLSIKSNLLYDMALIPNLKVEVAIQDRWSVGAQALCGWWLKENNSRCWQLQAADLEGRYWLGDRSKYRELSGWFAGVFASAGFYDFQVEDTKGLQGEFYVMTGVSGGYSMAIGRRMNLEFAAGVGYVVNDYQKYTVYEDKYLVADGPTMRFQSLFPAKIEVSLGWLMFRRGDKRSESRREYRVNREEGVR